MKRDELKIQAYQLPPADERPRITRGAGDYAAGWAMRIVLAVIVGGIGLAAWLR